MGYLSSRLEMLNNSLICINRFINHRVIHNPDSNVTEICLKTLRRVQEKVSDTWEINTVDQDSTSAPAASAIKQKRLTFAWLDGEAQHVSSDPSIVILIILCSGLIC